MKGLIIFHTQRFRYSGPTVNPTEVAALPVRSHELHRVPAQTAFHEDTRLLLVPGSLASDPVGSLPPRIYSQECLA